MSNLPSTPSHPASSVRAAPLLAPAGPLGDNTTLSIFCILHHLIGIPVTGACADKRLQRESERRE